MNKNILENSIEDFILKYKAAVKVKLTKQQLSEFLDMKVESMDRKRRKIAARNGMNLELLKSDPNSTLTSKVEKEYLDQLEQMGGIVQKAQSMNAYGYKKSATQYSNKKYIVTSAQNATPVFKNFLTTLLLYCEENDAELIIIPYRYRNPTSVWSIASKETDWWENSISDYIVDNEYRVAKHLKIMGHIKMQPTATNPLSGFNTVVDMESAIFGHPRIELSSIASPVDGFPRILTTTGAITLSNYTDSKAGHKGLYHHTYGATVVDVDNDGDFHIRQVKADSKSGSFYDLDKLYTINGVKYDQQASALVAGDIHAEVADLDIVDTIYRNSDSISAHLKPKNYIIHDLLDFNCRSHHNIRDELGRYRKHIKAEDNNVEEALQIAADFLEYIHEDDTKMFVVKSNHDEHLDRWLAEADPKLDSENAKFYHYLKYHQYKSIFNDEEFDTFEFWCKNPDELVGLSDEVLEDVIFLRRDDSLQINNVELSLHGDQGPNGSRGTLRSLSRIGQKLIIGHSHTPGIINGSYQVGTTTPMNLEYTRGPSSWMNTVAILYPDGNITLINIVNGKWKG